MATDVESTLAADDYDEFGLLHENAEELGLPFAGRPDVSRGYVDLAADRRLSYIRWGTADPEVVFLHGGAQNAHTWDYVALALGRPAVAFDLPGHGRSSWRADRDYGPWRNVEALATALPAVAPNAAVVVGMSLGGLTVTHLAATRPDLCRRAVIVDVTPQVNDPSRTMTTAERGSVALVSGPPTYASFEEMADAAVALSPLRAAAGVRRGVRHNARRLPDGRWSWRYDLFGPPPPGTPDWLDFTSLWDEVDTITVPTLLVRGGESRYVLDADVAEFRRRLPALRYALVDGAGHAVQSDRPLELVTLIRDFAFPA
ncbi:MULTISPECIES: alpha/beta fold hydrolase [Frankia]|uniref:Hydrolase n=2 Tax=Frankia TaxID=1854 RepID=Q0RIN1_FRAAA|nr:MULTISPECIES: alpha/beta hydrolase [Frankia]CAJ62637.1 putative hydrolase [Frankia alni ACN14a]